MTEKEEKEHYTFVPDGKEKKPGLVIGRKSSTWITEQSDKTMLLIAPPGSGKTKSVFLPTFYYNAEVNKRTGKGASILSIDVKSENFICGKSSRNAVIKFYSLSFDFRFQVFSLI